MEAQLPDHLLELVLGKLIPLSGDYFRFGAVCKEWCKIMIENRKRIPSRSQIPVLMIPSNQNDKTRRSIYDVTQSKQFDSVHPLVPYDTQACGSSYGWLFFLDEKSMQIILYNPFSKKNHATNVRSRILLPPINYNCRIDEVSKVMLFGNPSDQTSDYVVLAFYESHGFLALLKSWCHLMDGFFSDAVLYQGLIYLFEPYRGIFTIDVFSKNRYGFFLEVEHFLKRNDPYGWNTTYIVVSFNGELLVVMRLETSNYEDGMFKPLTVGLEVEKLCRDGEVYKLVKVDSLDGDAIFVGLGHSVCVSSYDFQHCQPNSIYFTYDDFMPHPGPCGPNDCGVFSLEDKSIKPVYPYDPSHEDLPPPIWVLPMF